MSAQVVPAYTDPEAVLQNFMVECLDCKIEWGWAKHAPGVLDRLELMAEEHNTEFHPQLP